MKGFSLQYALRLQYCPGETLVEVLPEAVLPSQWDDILIRNSPNYLSLISPSSEVGPYDRADVVAVLDSVERDTQYYLLLLVKMYDGVSRKVCSKLMHVPLFVCLL